jgi:hypothetical protein
MSDPQALHAELLELSKPPVAGTVPTALTLYGPAAALTAALTAVLELHKPEPCTWSRCDSPRVHRVCGNCGPSVNYPCQTVKVIAAALGVTTDG